MKAILKFILASTLVLGLLSIVFGALVMFNMMSHPDISFTVNDFDVSTADMSLGYFLGGMLTLVICAAVFLVVVPLSLLLGLALPLLILGVGLGIGLMALVGVGAVALSPILIFVLPLIWLARRNRARPAR